MTALKQYNRDPSALNMPWLDSPFAEELIKNANLSPENKKLCHDYRQNGYVVIDSGLSSELIDTVIESVNPYYYDNSLRTFSSKTRIQDAWLAPDHKMRCAVRSVATEKTVLDTLRVLYQREPVPFQTLNFPVGTQQGTHSDHIHFSSEPKGFMCGVWIALEDIHTDAGPLHYYPGSHRLPYIDPVTMGFSGSHRFQKDGTHEAMGSLYRPYLDLLHSMCRAQGIQKERLIVKKGQALIWAANLLHGGEPINNPKLSRHSQVSHYYFEGSSFYTPLLSDPFLGRVATRPVINMRTLREHRQEYANIRTAPNNRDRLWSTPGLDIQPTSSCRPLQFETNQHRRLLLWPDYDNHDSLEELVQTVIQPLSQESDLAFCFYRDPGSDPSTASIQEKLDHLFERHSIQVGKSDFAQMLIIDQYVADEDWNKLQTEVTGVYLSEADKKALRRLELIDSRLPLILDSNELIQFFEDSVTKLQRATLLDSNASQVGY